MHHGLFLSAVSSKCIIEEIPAQFFWKPLTIFAKSSIVDVQLDYKYASVLPPGIKPIYKDLLLWQSVIKIATVLYYRFIIQSGKIERQSNTS